MFRRNDKLLLKIYTNINYAESTVEKISIIGYYTLLKGQSLGEVRNKMQLSAKLEFQKQHKKYVNYIG